MRQNQQIWRNPHQAKRRLTPTPAKRAKAKLSKLIPPKRDTRQAQRSLIAIRNQVREFREQIEQMERTMDTLCNVVEAIDKFNAPGKNRGTQSNLLKSFQNIDFKQVMNLLQSPLVQALVETLAEEETSKK